MADNMDFTMMFNNKKKENKMNIEQVISYVKDALEEKGYSSLNQIVGYLLSGDPTYITNHKDARTVITKYERDEILEYIVKFYIKNHK